MISGLGGISYEEKCRELKLETLEARRERQDLLEAYKIIHREPQPGGEKLLVRSTVRGAITRTAADPWRLEVKTRHQEIYFYITRTSQMEPTASRHKSLRKYSKIQKCSETLLHRIRWLTASEQLRT